MKQAEYNQRLAEIDQQAQVRQAELIQPVMDRITTVIEAMREEGSYSLIFDVAAQGIISADSALDLTQEVIRRLTATTPPGGGL
jgi:Skp family chaperone for outer membrane proteins